jgi:hypothetical protein
MTSSINGQSFGPPPVITELTIEQDLKIRQIKDALENPETKKEDIITVFLALQRQTFCLSNNVSNLVKNWPTPLRITPEDPSKFGIS